MGDKAAESSLSLIGAQCSYNLYATMKPSICHNRYLLQKIIKATRSTDKKGAGVPIYAL